MFLDSIEIPNAAWINEFEGSKVRHTIKYTEEGRKFDFQKRLQKRDAPIVIKTECVFSKALELAAFRDSGLKGDLTLDDGRTFSVLLESADGLPFFEDTAVFTDEDYFAVRLNFIEV